MELPIITFIDNIHAGKIDSNSKVRIIRIWTQPKFKNPSEANN